MIADIDVSQLTEPSKVDQLIAMLQERTQTVSPQTPEQFYKQQREAKLHELEEREKARRAQTKGIRFSLRNLALAIPQKLKKLQSWNEKERKNSGMLPSHFRESLQKLESEGIASTSELEEVGVSDSSDNPCFGEGHDAVAEEGRQDDPVVGDLSCMLNQVGTTGLYKFYEFRVTSRADDEYALFSRWGRLGEAGMSKITLFAELDEATATFKQLFFGKTGNGWDDRHNFERKPNKYFVAYLFDNSQESDAETQPTQDDTQKVDAETQPTQDDTQQVDANQAAPCDHDVEDVPDDAIPFANDLYEQSLSGESSSSSSSEPLATEATSIRAAAMEQGAALFRDGQPAEALKKYSHALCYSNRKELGECYGKMVECYGALGKDQLASLYSSLKSRVE